MKKKEINIKLLEKFIKDFIKKNDRLPKMKEFSVQNGSPYGRGLIEKQYSGIQNICKILNIEYTKQSKSKKQISDTEVKNFIQSYLNEYGKLPTSIKFNKRYNAPCSLKVINDNYGSLIECYSKLGFDVSSVQNRNKFDDNVMLEYINDYRNKNGYNPGVNDFNRNKGCPYNKERILKRFGSIERMYNFYNLQPKPISKTDVVSDKKLLDDLLEAVYKYRTTDRDELHYLSPETIYDRSVYERRFGTWSDALKKASFTSYNRVLLAKFIDYNGEEPIGFLISKIGINGSLTPKQKKLLERDKLNYSVQVKYFKSGNFYKMLRNEDIKMVDRLIIKQRALDGHVCDSNSEKIVDNFLFKNGIKHDIHVKYPDGKKICDFMVNDIYIEYAGLYNSFKSYNTKIEYKINYCKENNLKLYILYDLSKKSLNDLKSFINNNCQQGGFNE